MRFFSVALALGLALTATASPAGSSSPVVQAVEPRADAGCTCDDAQPGEYRMPYPNWGKWKSKYNADVKKYGHNKYGGHHHKDSCSSGKGHGSMGGHGSSDGHSSGHGGGGMGGFPGNHHNGTGNGGNGEVDVPANDQDIACSAGAPFCCFADNGSQGGQICSNNVTACDSTVICCNNNGGFQICIGDLEINAPLTINIFM